MRIPKSFIDDLLLKIDIIDVIDKSVPLKKSGNNYMACCPFHNEKHPSFSVNARKQFYYCFGCGASGNAISFLIEHDNLTFPEAIEQLAQSAGMTVPREASDDNNKQRYQFYEIMSSANDFYQQQLRHHNSADKIKDYLKNRGLTGKIAKTFQVGFAPAGWDNLRKHLNDIDEAQLLACGLSTKNEQGKIYDRFRDRIMFPIRDRQGRVIGFGGRTLDDNGPKYLNSPETAIFHKGNELYGLYEALQSNRRLQQIIVVEGYMDVIALAQHNISNAVATLGTATTKSNAERLFRQTNDIVFCFDGDQAGRTAAWRALENILPLLEDGRSARFMFLPDGEDPDTLVRNQGEQAFLQLIEEAIPLATFLLSQLSKDLDLNSLDGRSRLAKLAEPLLTQIPGKIFQQLLLEELAKQTRMDATQLRNLLNLPVISEKVAPWPKQSDIKNKPISLMQKAIILILQHPEIVTNDLLNSDYTDIDLPGGDVLSDLLGLLKKEPKLTTGSLLEHWRDSKLNHQLNKLATREILVPKNNLADELKSIFRALSTVSEEQKLLLWQQKAADGALTDAEKREYLALLAQQKSNRE